MENIFLRRGYGDKDFYFSCSPLYYDESLTWCIAILDDGLYRVHCDNWSYDYDIPDTVTMREAWRFVYGRMRKIIRKRREERKREEYERKHRAIESAYWMAQQRKRLEAYFEAMEKAFKA